jgi:hypothetical protein
MRSKLSCLTAVCLVCAVAASAGATELGQGKVLFEYWFNMGGTSVDANLRTNPRFPDHPDQSEWRDGFESRVNWGDNFGTRARAFLTPPETGAYTFWVAGDDNCQLWLSTDADPANAVKIAQVATWTAPKQWTKEAGQKSAPVQLVGGQTYYIEALMKEGTGGDSVEAAWAGPGIGDEPAIIGGDYVTAFGPDIDPARWAWVPRPSNGAVDWTSQEFSWIPGATAVKYNIYIGTSEELTDADMKIPFTPNGTYFSLDPFLPATTYYWRVDQIDADDNVFTGNVWSFTMKDVKATEPSPYDGAIWRKTDLTVSWKAGWNAVSHKVYGSTEEAAVAAGDPGALLATVPEPRLDASAMLEPGNIYYWRVDEVDSTGQVVPGDVWTFSTMFEDRGGAMFEVWTNIGGGNVSDLTNNARFPRSPDVVEFLPADFEAPVDYADNFGARVSAWLHVPVAGEYTFWIASDDSSALFLGADKPSAVQIASVSGWTGSRAWDSMASQKSAPIQLEAGVYYLAALYKEGGGGDNCSVAWQGPAVPNRELVGAGFIEPFINVWADDPRPVDGAERQPDVLVLDWQPGEGAVEHVVYVSTNKNAVATSAAAARAGKTTDPFFITSPLNWNATYYWKVDEVDADGNVIPGFIWSFKVPDYLPVVDGAVTVNYNNTDDPFATELLSGLAVPLDSQDWTKNGVNSLQLQLKGREPKITVADGVYTMQARSGDVWGSTDNFRFFYKQLTGDGTVVAKIHSQTRPNTDWAKAGVMVRQSLDRQAAHGFMSVTPNLRRAFQNRPVAAAGSFSAHSPANAITLPLWVKLVREGTQVTAFYSTDGEDWIQQPDTENTGGDRSPNPQTIELDETVYVGFAVTSNQTANTTTVKFSDLTATGSTGGNWQVVDIGPLIPIGNDPAPIYVALVDSDGKTAVVNHPGNPNVPLSTDWLTWKIPTSKFGGVNLKKIVDLVVGIGDGLPGGTGALQVADIQVVKPFAVAVQNHSFETVPAGSAPAIRIEFVPGWNCDGVAPKSGVRSDFAPAGMTGARFAFLTNGDPGIWQTSNHVIVEGEEFEVTIDANMFTGVIRDSIPNLRLSLYYEQDGARVQVATRTMQVPHSRQTYSLSFATGAARAAVGHKLGVEIRNISLNDCTVAVDNVRLRVK